MDEVVVVEEEEDQELEKEEEEEGDVKEVENGEKEVLTKTAGTANVISHHLIEGCFL